MFVVSEPMQGIKSLVISMLLMLHTGNYQTEWVRIVADVAFKTNYSSKNLFFCAGALLFPVQIVLATGISCFVSEKQSVQMFRTSVWHD